MKHIVILGFFDGVHLGHGELLRRAAQRKLELGLPTLAMSFDRHPASVISGTVQTLITLPADRERLMRELYGIDKVQFLHFGKALMQMPWEEFLEQYLLREAEAAHVICGWDYRFGYRGAGDAEKLTAFCADHGIGCDVIPEFSLDGIPVHSTRIREQLHSGELEEAERYLGHPFLYSGKVISGKQLGRTMGTPTANLAYPEELIQLPEGVYAAEARFDGQNYAAVVNIGTCPTVSDSGKRVTEAYLLDFSGDLYGLELELRFRTYLRQEQKFESLAALQSAIQGDAETTRALFSKQK